MKTEAEESIQDLIDVMAALRTPGTGCPWDLEQTFETIAPYTIEEAYEVADAIARGDRRDLLDELGDLLLQVVYHARLAEEEDSFSFANVADAITKKMIRRHPHVFQEEHVADAAAMTVRWEELKAAERQERVAERGEVADPAIESVLNGVALALPSLTRALKLQKKAARVGFDWDDVRSVLNKVREEVDELETALSARNDDQLREEIGDLLFSVTNVARHLNVDAEQALKDANAKFVERFTYIEEQLRAKQQTPHEATLEDMDALWNEAKDRRR